MPPVSFTVDLEDPTGKYLPDGRYVAMTRRILDLCEHFQCKATFFTIGRVATAAPELVRDIAKRGHEVAFHSHDHVPLTEENPERFRRESREDKDRFEQLTGTRVAGFRAPRFSLTPKSVWALDILGELGFTYSSSVMPTEVSLFGFPSAPRTPFTWPNGMIEFPLPVAQIGKYRLPYLGGIYLYTLPRFVVRGFLKRANADEVLWTYTHPYDFDSEEKYSRMAGVPVWISLILWCARKVAVRKITFILQQGIAPPLMARTQMEALKNKVKMAATGGM